MGRNLYILAAMLAALAVVAVVISFTHTAQQLGSAGDSSLWRTTGISLFVVALFVALGGVLSSLFEQAARRAENERANKRRR